MFLRRDPVPFFFLVALMFFAVPSRAQAPAATGRLASVLSKAAAYCQRLDKAALDFVCLEEVTETSHNLSANTDVFLYDYQFVRKGGRAQEQRNLVSFNGKKADYKETQLHTAFFRYENVLFGPVGLLNRSWQTLLEYRLVGEDAVLGQNAVVIEATPGPDLNEPHPYGKIWIREDDGSVLKILWDQRSLGNFKMVKEWADQHEAEPQITSFSEYGFEKNGLRFPSRSYTEQAYLRKDRGRFSNAEIRVIYKDYRFFTVETETIY